MNAWQRSEPFYFAPEKKPGGAWICFKDSPSPPPAPDFNASAVQQGEENRKTSLAQNVLGNPNITNAYGSQHVTYSTDPVTGQMQSNVNQTLNPTSQGIFDQQQGQNAQLTGIAQNLMPNVAGTAAQPLNWGPSQDAYKYGIANAGNIQGGVASGGDIQKGFAAGGNIQNAVNTNGVAAMPVNAGMTGQNAILSRLQPQIDRSNAAQQQQLANQGIALGSDAYKTAQNLQGQNNNDLYTQAALQGINLDMAANQQGFGQGLASGQFANAAQQQQFGQNQAQGQFANQAENQQFQENLNQGNFANSAQAQQYTQNANDAAFGNKAGTDAIQQQILARQYPLQQLQNIRNAAPVNVPQFQQYQGAGMTPAPLMQGAQSQAAANQNMFNAQQGQANSFNSGLFSLGSSAIGAMALGGMF